MHHQWYALLAYLGQMLEKGVGFAVGIFPKMLIMILSQDCPNPLKVHIYPLLLCLSIFGKFIVTLTDTHISLSHTVHDSEIWGIKE